MWAWFFSSVHLRASVVSCTCFVPFFLRVLSSILVFTRRLRCVCVSRCYQPLSYHSSSATGNGHVFVTPCECRGYFCFGGQSCASFLFSSSRKLLPTVCCCWCQRTDNRVQSIPDSCTPPYACTATSAWCKSLHQMHT